MEIQSILFDKDYFTPTKARNWLKKHKFHYEKIDSKGNYHRFRQKDPEYYSKFSSKKIKNNTIILVFGLKHGSGLNDMISGLTSEMHLFHPDGENVPGGSFNGLQTYSYCGPGTKFYQRYKEGYRGVNLLDQGCMYHDLGYALHKDVAGRNVYDKYLAALCDKIVAEPDIDEQQKADARFVSAIMKSKVMFGL